MALDDDSEEGFTTVEFALVLPVFILALALGLFVISAAATKVRVGDAARDVALTVARGGDPSGIPIPADGEVTISGTETITATVTVTLKPLGDLLPPLNVTGSATTVQEPGTP